MPSKTYLIATLVARDSQGQATAYPTATSSPTAPEKNTPRSRSVPMIILYCAAGIIGVLLLSVIITGVSWSEASLCRRRRVLIVWDCGCSGGPSAEASGEVWTQR